jgi:hypothetical protein
VIGAASLPYTKTGQKVVNAAAEQIPSAVRGAKSVMANPETSAAAEIAKSLYGNQQ